MDAAETSSDAAQRDCTTDDVDKLTALNESITADSDGSLPLRDSVTGDVHVVDDAENIAADADDQKINEDHVESVSAEDNSILELDGSELVNDDQSQLSSDLAADSTQDPSRVDVPVAGDECASDGPSQPASDDTTQSQQLDAADSNMPASGSDAQSEPVDSNVSQPSDSHRAGDADDTSQFEEASADNNQETSCMSLPLRITEEPSTADSNDDPAEYVEVSQPSDSHRAADAGHMSQCDEASADNNQETSCTSLPLRITEEPSTADSNDDPAEYVEASTSLNPDCADTEPMTGVDTQQQQLEDDDDDDKDDEQFVDSASDISPPQPVEGNIDL